MRRPTRAARAYTAARGGWAFRLPVAAMGRREERAVRSRLRRPAGRRRCLPPHPTGSRPAPPPPLPPSRRGSVGRTLPHPPLHHRPHETASAATRPAAVGPVAPPPVGRVAVGGRHAAHRVPKVQADGSGGRNGLPCRAARRGGGRHIVRGERREGRGGGSAKMRKAIVRDGVGNGGGGGGAKKATGPGHGCCGGGAAAGMQHARPLVGAQPLCERKGGETRRRCGRLAAAPPPQQGTEAGCSRRGPWRPRWYICFRAAEREAAASHRTSPAGEEGATTGGAAPQQSRPPGRPSPAATGLPQTPLTRRRPSGRRRLLFGMGARTAPLDAPEAVSGRAEGR